MRPEMEKRGFELRHVIYIIILIGCLVSIGTALYIQFYQNEKIGVIIGISNEKEDEEYKKLKENFLNIFDNTVERQEIYNGEIEKIRSEEDVILIAFNTQEQTENYTLDLKIPYFNINSDVAKRYNQQIRANFKQTSEDIIKSDSQKNVVYNVKFKVYEQNEILSLVILSEFKEGESSEKIIIKTYNYNLRTNESVSIDDIISKKEINIDDANNTIKKEINSSQEQNLKLAKLGYNVNIRDVNDDTYKIENAKEYFLGTNGYLYIIYPYGNEEFTSEMDVVIIK